MDMQYFPYMSTWNAWEKDDTAETQILYYTHVIIIIYTTNLIFKAKDMLVSGKF